MANEHEWLRFQPAWHLVMGGLAACTAALILVDAGIDSTARSVALALTAALASWYAFVGRRAVVRESGWYGPGYLAVAAPLTLGLFAAAPVGALMLFALYPHLWAMLPPRRAIVATIAVVIGVALVAMGLPLDGAAVDTAVVMGTVSLVVALVLGLWIARIIRQSGRRAELVAELAATRSDLAAVSRTAGVLAERERLAHEIHDTLAQGFASVLLLLEAAEATLDAEPAQTRQHLQRARATARENLAEARALVAALTPPDLTQTSLPEALRRIVERTDAEDGLVASLEVTGTPCGLPAEHEVALLRSAQEALTNVRRHSGAATVEVVLAYEETGVGLSVRDDGCGFDPDVPRSGGYGLAGMRARVGRIGGAVSVVAAPDQGVTVRVDVPVG